MVASLMGGAILLFSCQNQKGGSSTDVEKMITQQSDTLTMIYTKNGKKDYRFYTPLMERYELAREPYMEFRYGINIITYDSLGSDASNLVADYAIFYERRELWECRGNVVGRGEDGRELYTQQLFWDQKTDKVYSNVDCKIVDGGDVFVGEGFESDSEFKDWVFRESEGRMWVDASQASDEEVAAAKAAEEQQAAEQQEAAEVGPESPDENAYYDEVSPAERERRRVEERERRLDEQYRRQRGEEPDRERSQIPQSRRAPHLTPHKLSEGEGGIQRGAVRPERTVNPDAAPRPKRAVNPDAASRTERAGTSPRRANSNEQEQ